MKGSLNWYKKNDKMTQELDIDAVRTENRD